ncbi:MAG: MFS transporter [Actinobacteria bacterium]|nr:MFS transporter [Actinomycetota bacterium]
MSVDDDGNARSTSPGVLGQAPKSIMVTFVGVHLVNDLYSTILPAFLPAVAEEFDLNYTELGVLSFAFILLSGVLQPIIGNTADRLGRRRFVLVTGFAVGAVGFLAMAIAPTFWFIVAVSLLCGLGAATYHPQANAFIVIAHPKQRGRMLGIHGWGGSAGHFLAPAVAVLLVAAFDWRIAMALIALPLLVVAVVLQRRLDETTPAPGVTLRGALSRQLVLVAVAFGMVSIVGRSFVTFFVKMLVDEGWTEKSAGLTLTLILVGGAVAQPLGGWGFDRIGGRSVFLLSTLAISACTAVFAISSGAVSLVAIAGISFFSFSLFPVGLALASQQVPSAQTGAATGVVFGVSGLMTAAAQPVVGALGESVGDIRIALAWLLPVALLAVMIGSRISSAPQSR